MRRIIIGVALGASILPATGCVSLGSRTGNATYMGHSEALDVTELGKAEKAGQSCSSNVLGIVAIGDSSIATAKKLGGVTQVVTVDTVFTGYGRLYGKICTTVRGL